MTRTEFNRHFAVKLENTEGFTYKQIAWINDYIFEKVSGEYATAPDMKSTIDHLFVEAEIALSEHETRF